MAPGAKGIIRQVLIALGVFVFGGGIFIAMLTWHYGSFIHLKGNLTPYAEPPSDEGHYKRLEKSRQEQKAKPLIASPATANESAGSWTNMRGAKRDGISEEKGLLKEWPSRGPKELYRQPIGKGLAGFVIGGGRAYTIEQRRHKEAIVCYDLGTGTEIWVSDYSTLFAETMGGDGPRATPTLDGERLYALGAVGRLTCVDAATGKELWDAEVLKGHHDDNLIWGMACSPLIVDDKVIVTAAGLHGESVHAYDKMTGKSVWKSLPEQQGYTSLMDVQLAGRRQILNVAGGNANGLDPATGALLWSFPWKAGDNINCSQPIVAGPNRVFLSSGYGKGCALIEIAESGGKLEAKQLYANMEMQNKFNSSVLVDGFVYGLDEGILVCMELETGKRKWKNGRYGYGQLIYADGNLIVITEEGDLVLVKATPEAFTEVSKFSAIPGKSWNLPALADGKLLVRNERLMACYDLRADGGS